MKITIHQPEHAPWLGLLDKISKCDVFVILDTVQFRKNYFQNRNRIGTEENPIWLTVPVKKHPLSTKIKDIEISGDSWKVSYLGKLKETYNGSKFIRYYDDIAHIIMGDYKYISELNIDIIKYLLKVFNIKTEIVKASDLNLPEVVGGNEVVLQICKHFKADIYLSGEGGRDYLELDKFEGIKVEFNEPNCSKLSSFDLLLRNGNYNFN